MLVLSRAMRLLVAALLLVVLPCAYPCPAFAKKSENNPDASKSVSGLILSGQINQALSQAQKQNVKKLKKDHRNRLRFMRAYLNYSSKNFKAAAEEFEELEKDYPVLKNYIQFYEALSLRGQKENKKAIKLLEDLQKSGASRHLKQKVKRELAWTYCQAGDRGKAIPMYNELIQTEPSQIRSYQMKYDRSLCLIELGAPSEALITLRALYLNYPEGDLSQKILQTLKDMNQQSAIGISEHLRRGDLLMAKDRPQLAAQDYQWVLDHYHTPAPGSLLKKLAEAYFKSRQYPLAAPVYEKIRSRHPELFDADAKLRLAQSYSRSDQYDKAIAAYEYLANSEPGENQTQLEYKIAYIYMDKGDLKEANRRFVNLLERYPPRRPHMLWFLAWNHYRLENFEQALAYLDKLSANQSRHYLARRAPYWRARILEKQGKKSQARQIYLGIIEGDPFSYYGFVSLKRLENNLDPTKPPKGSFAGDIPAGSLPAPFSWSRLTPGGKAGRDRAEELLAIGLWNDFLGELGELTSGEGITGELAKLKRAVSGNNDGLGFGSGRWAASYPPAYSTLVSLFAKSRGFPMAATWAIMREESRFKPNAQSPAQAIGLMQIIPPTGAEIAEDLGREGYVPEWLFQPVTNIEFGVHYLHKNWQTFGRRFPETFASYNAGPDAVTRWLKARPDREWDEFIEEIPYKETNNYVKKVLKSYYIYQLLYPESR